VGDDAGSVFGDAANTTFVVCHERRLLRRYLPCDRLYPRRLVRAVHPILAADQCGTRRNKLCADYDRSNLLQCKKGLGFVGDDAGSVFGDAANTTLHTTNVVFAASPKTEPASSPTKPSPFLHCNKFERCASKLPGAVAPRRHERHVGPNWALSPGLIRTRGRKGPSKPAEAPGGPQEPMTEGGTKCWQRAFRMPGRRESVV
jgi:hypothetical protein